MSSWVDTYFAETIAETHVPGAVVVIVQEGQVVFSRGYGVASLGGEQVDPNETLFRLGSISKVVTALMALEMIEAGEIDPSADVNTYLEQVEVPAAFNRAVTISDLLTHQGGFAADLRGMERATDAEAQISPAEMQRLLVSRARPPGFYPAYDNNGWGLLGLSLADGRGVSFRELARTRVFEPFGMSSAVVGVPDNRRGQSTSAYQITGAGDASEIDLSLLVPTEQGAGDVSASGADMARFMTALLQRGQLDGRAVISPAALAQLTDFDAHRLHPSLAGYGAALYEARPAGRFAMRHDGGMRGAASSMMLYPDAGIGVFWAINARPENPFDGETMSGLVRGVVQYLSGPPPAVSIEDFLRFLDFHKAFAERYIPANPAFADVGVGGELWSDEVLQSLQGRYLGTSSQYESFIGNLQVEVIEGRPVVLGADGKLLIGGQPHTQIGPGLFQNDETGDRLGFSREENGVFLGENWLFRQQLMPSWRNPLLTVVPLVLFPLLLLTGLIHAGRANARRTIGVSAALLGLAYAAGWMLEAEFATRLLVSGAEWVSLIWRITFSIAALGLALLPFLMVRNFFASPLRLSFKGVSAGVHFLLIAMMSSSLAVLAVYWNLINPLR